MLSFNFGILIDRKKTNLVLESRFWDTRGDHLNWYPGASRLSATIPVLSRSNQCLGSYKRISRFCTGYNGIIWSNTDMYHMYPADNILELRILEHGSKLFQIIILINWPAFVPLFRWAWKWTVTITTMEVAKDGLELGCRTLHLSFSWPNDFVDGPQCGLHIGLKIAALCFDWGLSDKAKFSAIDNYAESLETNSDIVRYDKHITVIECTFERLYRKLVTLKTLIHVRARVIGISNNWPRDRSNCRGMPWCSVTCHILRF